MQKRIEIVNGQKVEVTVCPSAALSPREVRLAAGNSSRAYRTDKQKQERLQKSGLKQAAALNAYDLATQFGVEQTTISESEFLWKNSKQRKPNVPASRVRLSDFDI
jgi:hypothetical protein